MEQGIGQCMQAGQSSFGVVVGMRIVGPKKIARKGVQRMETMATER